MKHDRQAIWIEAGYALFAAEGPKGLKIEVLAKQVDKNKSSFYHHFADLVCFEEMLLKHHLERAKIIAARENECRSVDPELLEVLVDIQQDLFFNRQLRIHRANEAYRQCFERANGYVGEPFFKLWAQELGLDNKPKLAEVLFALVLENFYLQLTAETLNKEWLTQYFRNVKTMVIALGKAQE